MDSNGSGNKNKRRLGESVPCPRLASKERTLTWGTIYNLIGMNLVDGPANILALVVYSFAIQRGWITGRSLSRLSCPVNHAVMIKEIARKQICP